MPGGHYRNDEHAAELICKILQVDRPYKTFAVSTDVPTFEYPPVPAMVRRIIDPRKREFADKLWRHLTSGAPEPAPECGLQHAKEVRRELTVLAHAYNEGRAA